LLNKKIGKESNDRLLLSLCKNENKSIDHFYKNSFHMEKLLSSPKYAMKVESQAKMQ
jgi:hypothetical protein